MDRVWSYSKQSGGALLVLLAIADSADDAGVAYPGFEKLAMKTRLTERQVRRSAKKMEREGELEIRPRVGPHQRHEFKVLTDKNVSNQTGKNVRVASGNNVRASNRTKCPPSTGHLEPVRPDISCTSNADICDTPPTPPYKADPLNTDPSEIHSVATQRGADAPPQHQTLPIPPTAKEPDDFALWHLGLRMLMKSIPQEDRARAFIGKQIKDFGRPLVNRASVDMLANNPINPSQYFVATLQSMSARVKSPRSEVGKSLGRTAPGIFGLALQAVELAMSVEGLSLAQAVARLRNQDEQGSGLEGVTQPMIEMIIRQFVDERGCVYEAEVA